MSIARQRGSLTLEMAFLVPLMLVMLLAMVEVFRMLVMQTMLSYSMGNVARTVRLHEDFKLVDTQARFNQALKQLTWLPTDSIKVRCERASVATPTVFGSCDKDEGLALFTVSYDFNPFGLGAVSWQGFNWQRTYLVHLEK